MSQQFCLKWNNHMSNMMDVFKNLLSAEALVDVTLACDGQSLKAHKIVLSACSPFFQSLFLGNPCKHPIVILKDMNYSELKAVIEFMYHGEVNVALDQLSAFMKAAETLRVKGLAEVTEEKKLTRLDETSHRTLPKTKVPSKCRKSRTRKRSLSDHSGDETSEPESEQLDSPETEELHSERESSSSRYLSASSLVPMEVIPNHSTNSFLKQYQHPVDQGTDEDFSSEEKFHVEPSKLLEQTLITDDLPRDSLSVDQSNIFNVDIESGPHSSIDHPRPLFNTSMTPDSLVVASQDSENSSKPVSARNKENVPADAESVIDIIKTESFQEECEVDIGGGVKVKERDLKRCSYQTFSKLTTDLMSLLFSRQEMATSSLTGKISNAHASMILEAKPALDPDKVAAIIGYVLSQFPEEATFQRIRRIIAYKLKYEALKKFGRSYTKVQMNYDVKI